jgi:hypothetical protein
MGILFTVSTTVYASRSGAVSIRVMTRVRAGWRSQYKRNDQGTGWVAQSVYAQWPGYGLGDAEIGIRFPVGVRNFSFHRAQIGFGAHPAFYSMDTGNALSQSIAPRCPLGIYTIGWHAIDHEVKFQLWEHHMKYTASKSSQYLAARYLAHCSFQILLAFHCYLSFKEGRDIVLMCGLFRIKLSIFFNCIYIYFYTILISKCMCSCSMKMVRRDSHSANLKGHSAKTSMSFKLVTTGW